MGKFCGMCGTPLEEGWIACPKCAHRVTQKSEKAECITVVPEVQRTPEPVAIPEPAPVVESPVAQELPAESFTFDETQSEVEKPKKKKKALRITAVILAVLVVAGSVFGVWWLFKPKTQVVAGKEYLLFENKYGEYLSTFEGLVCLGDLEEYSPVFYDASVENPQIVKLDEKTAVVDEHLYIFGITGGVSKAKFVDSTTIEYDMWIDSKEFYEQLGESADYTHHRIRKVQESDGYIYFNDDSYWTSEKRGSIERNTRIGRVCIKDEKVEWYDEDITAKDFVVNKDYIYYSSNGLDAESGESHIEDAGIFRVKTDGGKIEKLLDVNDSAECGYDESCYSDLSVYKSKLYFVDNTGDKRKLCVMKCDGGDYEIIAEECYKDYTIDKDKIYYTEKNDDEYSIVEMSTKNLSKKTVITSNEDFGNIVCRNGNLYVTYIMHYIYSTEDEPEVVSLICDLDKKTMKALYTYNVYEEDVEVGYGMPMQKPLDTIYYWDDYDGNDFEFE